LKCDVFPQNVSLIKAIENENLKQKDENVIVKIIETKRDIQSDSSKIKSVIAVIFFSPSLENNIARL